MNLTELIYYLLEPDRFADLYKKFSVNMESEAILIYMKSLDIESEIYLFEIEETEDLLLYQKDGVTYHQLFPVEYAAELIESDLELKDRGFSDKQIAERLLEYRINDA